MNELSRDAAAAMKKADYADGAGAWRIAMYDQIGIDDGDPDIGPKL